jgi:hypothetical protein
MAKKINAKMKVDGSVTKGGEHETFTAFYGLIFNAFSNLLLHGGHFSR